MQRPNTHTMTQLLGCGMWDHVSGEHGYPLILQFHVYGEHSSYVCVSFDEKIQNLRF